MPDENEAAAIVEPGSVNVPVVHANQALQGPLKLIVVDNGFSDARDDGCKGAKRATTVWDLSALSEDSRQSWVGT